MLIVEEERRGEMRGCSTAADPHLKSLVCVVVLVGAKPREWPLGQWPDACDAEGAIGAACMSRTIGAEDDARHAR